MLRRTLTILTLAIAIGGAAATRAQETPLPSPQSPKAKAVPAPPVKTTPRIAPTPAPRVFATPTPPGVEDNETQAAPLTMKVPRNARVAVNSKLVNIHITGIDGDTLEATATSDEGTHPVKAQTTGDEANPKILIFVPQAYGRHGGREVNLNIRLPRYAALDAVESINGDIEVSGIDAPVAVSTNNGAITVVRVASVKASTRQGEITAREIKGDATARSTNGEITMADIGGTIDAAATNGSLNVRNAAGDLRANLTVGEVIAQCVKGRAEVNTVSGDIQLVGVSGDVEAVSTSGQVSLVGRIRTGGRYKLKSISGEIEMHIQPDAPGFTATLTTYNGEIETAFPLKLDSQASGGSTNRRIIGRFGDGSAQLMLDSFSGGVRLAKAKSDELKACK